MQFAPQFVTGHSNLVRKDVSPPGVGVLEGTEVRARRVLVFQIILAVVNHSPILVVSPNLSRRANPLMNIRH